MSKMRVTRSSRSMGNVITAIILICALSFSVFFMIHFWPPVLNFVWAVLGFVTFGFLGGFINVAYRSLFPEELYFELTEETLEIKDLRRSGHGYCTFTFFRRDLARIHYSNDEGIPSYVEEISGKKTRLVGEIFESWIEIRALLIREAKDIRVTEQHSKQFTPPNA